MALPFLPGYSFNKTVGQSKFHKSHHFDVSNEVPAMVGSAKPGIGGERLPFQESLPNNSIIPRGSGPNLPAWVAFDKQVLSFSSYYTESVTERADERVRVHQCKVLFFLEDDSLQVEEPREKNAGMPQGTLVRRHRVHRAPPNDNTYYTVEDLNIGNELVIYARHYRLIDCDQFTRNFLAKLGVKVGPPEPLPSSDAYRQVRKMIDGSMNPLRPYEKQDTLRQFLDHDRHVLRFFCVWDDRENNSFGDCRQMVLHYFLADDSIEVREVFPHNSGRDNTGTFLRRSRLPKVVDSLKRPGEIADRTVLNVFGPSGHGGRYILDSLKMGEVNQEFYKDNDLRIGAYVNVWGRKFLICDCDEFTKEYYRLKYGVNDFTPVRGAAVTSAQMTTGVAKEQRQIPPYNGFGSEEDTLNSCLSLLPRPPKRDFARFMEFDRRGMESHILRFLAGLETDKPIESERTFIINFYLADGTVSVFEPVGRSPGIPGGKFLERSRVKKTAAGSQYYSASDFYVGAVLELNKYKFILREADEYAYNYMESQPDEFPRSNVALVIENVKKMVAGKRIHELLAYGALSFDDFREMMHNICEGRLTNQEVITLARYYQDRGEGDSREFDTVVAVIQERLKRAGFEEFSTIEQQCLHFDLNRSGFVDIERLRTIFLAMRIPVQLDALRTLLSLMPLNEQGQVDYRAVLSVINWRLNKVEMPVFPSVGTGSANAWLGNQNQPAATLVQAVRVDALMRDLGA